MIGAATTTARALPRLASSRHQHKHKQPSSWGFYTYGLVMAAATATASISSRNDPTADDPNHQSGQHHQTHHHQHPSWKNPTNAQPPSSQKLWRPFSLFLLPTAYCDASRDEPSLSQEEQEFLNTIGLYQRWLEEIKKQWAVSKPSSIQWPTRIPQSKEISALEVDLQNYRKGGQGESRLCQDLEFRIACYYLFRESSVEEQRKGFALAKKLAVAGHPDGLCLYGTCVWVSFVSYYTFFCHGECTLSLSYPIYRAHSALFLHSFIHSSL